MVGENVRAYLGDIHIEGEDSRRRECDPPPQALQHLADRATGAGLAVLAPYPAEWMEAHAVSPRINSLKHNDAALIQRAS
jgi:hypothetical protein